MNQLISILIILCLITTTFGQSRKKENLLIFEATVLKIGKAPNVLCGVVAPYRLAEYKVEKVLQGKLDTEQIIVDHLFCKTDVLEDVKEGDKVLVLIDLNMSPLEKWNDGEIRKSGEKTNRYYVAKLVTKITNCCNF